MCSILAVDAEINPEVDNAFETDRTDPNAVPGYTLFRTISAPRGNPAIGRTADVYGISEAWLHNPAAPIVVRAQAHPARRLNSPTDFTGSGWTINFQNAAGTWLPAGFVKGSDGQQDDPAAGGAVVPRLMSVGVANPQMFACAGALTDDKKARTTWLLEIKPPQGSSNGAITFIQDLLSGDSHFDPFATRGQPLGGLGQPAKPPTPTISGPGNPVTQGNVPCAMTQSEDDVTTRELHMVAVDHGALYYSVASMFTTATNDNGSTFLRFNSVTPWTDLTQLLIGPNSGPITGATVLASRPNAISVLFVAQSGGRFRLFHTVRLPSGQWRPADDVLLLAGASPTGMSTQFSVAGGLCPASTPTQGSQDSELVYTLWDANQNMMTGRIVSTPQQWTPTQAGIYSPLINLTPLLSRSSDPSRQATILNMSIATRPFSDSP